MCRRRTRLPRRPWVTEAAAEQAAHVVRGQRHAERKKAGLDRMPEATKREHESARHPAARPVKLCSQGASRNRRGKVEERYAERGKRACVRTCCNDARHSRNVSSL